MKSHLQERDLQGKSHSYTSSLKGNDSLRLRNLHLIESKNHQWMNFHLQRKKRLRVIIIKIYLKRLQEFPDRNGILALLEIWEENQLDNVRKLFRDDETTDCERSRSPVINSGYKNG